MNRTLAAVCLVLLAQILSCRAEARDAVARWTAPGDDGDVGRATSYELRYKSIPPSADTLLWWQTAAIVGNVPSPSIAGARDSVVMTGLPTTRLYFVIVALDEAGNRSPWSNAAVLPELDIVRPARIGWFTVEGKP